jgi:hypothetical protein
MTLFEMTNSEITFGLVSVFFTLIGAAFYVVQRITKDEVMIEQQGKRIDALEAENRHGMENLSNKLDTIITQIMDVKIQLQNKQDRI